MMGMSPGPTSTQGPTIYRGEVPPTPKAIVTDAEWLRLLARASTAICPRLTDSDRERLESIAARLPNPEASEIMREALEPHRKAIQRALVAISRNRPSVEDTNLARRELNAVHEYLSSICKGEQ
jgi:hypothetical protein